MLSVWKFMIACSMITGVLFSATLAHAEVESSYTKLDFDNGCNWKQPESEEEAQMGGEAVCAGFGSYPVYFAEGDLRQFMAFGPVDDPMRFPGGFSEWNSVNDTIEWRHVNGKPYATILRWFIDNIDPDTGSANPSMRGQVLVISTIADENMTAGNRESCVAGYVDAKANSNANLLARQVADEVAANYRCGVDRPSFYGDRGSTSGTPNDLAGY